MIARYERIRNFLGAAVMFLMVGGLGCSAAKVEMQTGAAIEGYEAKVKLVSDSPVDYLKTCLAAAKEIKEFKTEFIRQERLGLFKELKPQEDIIAEYRDEPFSVRFTWRDEDSEYCQCTYIHGRDDNKVSLLPRKGLFGLPPEVQKYPAVFAVTFGKARNPITDFGPRRMMERILDRIEKAEAVGGVGIVLRPPTEIGPAKEPCFHLEIRYPEKDEYACKLQDLYINIQTSLPVATYLWLPGKDERCDATLDGLYMYSDLQPNVQLSDANFVIEQIKRKAAKGGREVQTASDVGSDADSGGAASVLPVAE
ncbi:MAG: DUF1571 domain-containing protein [Planctomycetia bacterium]|nr:DUF1571 domain-containing protein [Planctomycetia bacterium]MCC7314376.1 DUF1571 domain-containing protein [Planctomycetota bacterium]